MKIIWYGISNHAVFLNPCKKGAKQSIKLFKVKFTV